MPAVDISTKIRGADSGDAKEITRLCAELGYQASLEEIESRLSNLLRSENSFVAVLPDTESRLLGWVAAERRLLLESGERVEIVGLVVDHSARRRGIGQALVTAAEEWAKEKRVSSVFVRSNVVREASHHFYRRIGYVRQKTQTAYSKNLLGNGQGR